MLDAKPSPKQLPVCGGYVSDQYDVQDASPTPVLACEGYVSMINVGCKIIPQHRYPSGESMYLR